MATPDIQPDQPLKPHTTFKIGGPARYFAQAGTPEEYCAALEFARRDSLPVFVMGGGSNVLVSDQGFGGLVLHPSQRGLTVTSDDETSCELRCAAAETWDEVVRYSVEHQWWGIENLSHIPGQAGAALVQNIGAYGQQLSDVLVEAEVLEAATGAVRRLSRDECELGYRRSIFNSTARDRFIILALTLRLQKRGKADLRYPDVEAYFSDRGILVPALNDIRRAIISIRDRKFPFPQEEKGGNAGSFFKNLQLSETAFFSLQSKIQKSFPHYALERMKEIRKRYTGPRAIRIPSAYLIEICGLKGFRVGNAQVNEKQPLVLINLGGATADDVMKLAGHVRRTVAERTGVAIELEPELVGFSPEEVLRYLELGPSQ